MLSTDYKRNASYAAFLDSFHQQTHTFEDIIRFGEKWMRKAKLHHHFFGSYTLKANAEYLARFALGHAKDKQDFITQQEAEQILALYERRIQDRIPVEYITHEAEYLDHQFYVNEHVLVPRSLMNTRFQDFIQLVPWTNYRVLDLCTGSGCIGISLALMEKRLKVDLADLSKEALAVAQINIDRFALADRVRCIHSDVFAQIQDKYDLIITNPPYVSTREYQNSPDEFKNEPQMALEAGKDGLAIVDRILTRAKSHLNEDGLLIAEVGFTSAARIKKKYRHIPFKWFKYRRPNGKESWFGMHGVFMVWAKDL